MPPGRITTAPPSVKSVQVADAIDESWKTKLQK